MSQQARRIGLASLHERVPVQNPHDEIGALATVMNELLGRLDGGVALQRRFVADASHELRTPVAILQAEGEVTLSQASRLEGDYRKSLTVMGLAIDRLSRIVDDLFLLARADGGQRIIEARAVSRPRRNRWYLIVFSGRCSARGKDQIRSAGSCFRVRLPIAGTAY